MLQYQLTAFWSQWSEGLISRGCPITLHKGLAPRGRGEDGSIQCQQLAILSATDATRLDQGTAPTDTEGNGGSSCRESSRSMKIGCFVTMEEQQLCIPIHSITSIEVDHSDVYGCSNLYLSPACSGIDANGDGIIGKRHDAC